MNPMQSACLERTALIETAMGRRGADLCISNARLVNVYSGEILEGYQLDIAGRQIAYTGPLRAMVDPETTLINAKGAYLLPGYIDPHAHVDFWANPLSLTPYLLASGTTTVMAEPHDMVGATGLNGLDLFIKITRDLPLKFFFSLPVSSPPFPEFEGDDVVPIHAVERFLKKKEILALSEVTPWARVVEADRDLVAKFKLGEKWQKRIEGHTTGASGVKLEALAAAGLTSCHEALNASEARERVRLGMAVMLRHGSIRKDLMPLISLVTGSPKMDTRHVMFTPDWKSPSDILDSGYMDHLVCLAIEAGVAPVTAIQMATLNPATYLGLDRIVGGLAPGRMADILIVDDLQRPIPRMVIAGGQVVARDGKLIGELPPLPSAATAISWLSHRRIPDSVTAADFLVQCPAGSNRKRVPAMEIVDKTITRRKDINLPVTAGEVCLPRERDVLKIAAANRDGSGFVTAFLTGFGARVGGLASSIAHEHHRPLVIGCREDDMAAAMAQVRKLGGGMVLVHDGRVRAEIPFPMAGIMSAMPLETLSMQIAEMKSVLKKMGCLLDDPVFTLGFLTFTALPWVRITPEGLLDVKNRTIIFGQVI